MTIPSSILLLPGWRWRRAYRRLLDTGTPPDVAERAILADYARSLLPRRRGPKPNPNRAPAKRTPHPGGAKGPPTPEQRAAVTSLALSLVPDGTALPIAVRVLSELVGARWGDVAGVVNGLRRVGAPTLAKWTAAVEQAPPWTRDATAIRVRAIEVGDRVAHLERRHQRKG